MEDDQKTEIFSLIEIQNPRIIISSVNKIFSYHYPKKSFKDVERCYKQITKLFYGKMHGYKACNTEYHNLPHTLDTFLSVMRLIDGYNLREEKLPLRLAKNMLKAALFHNIGYIQEIWDNEGSGAKHTENHIGRSMAFLIRHKGDFGLDQEDMSVISNIIRCTGLNTKLNAIPFCSKEEEIAGLILGTSNILAQMSDREYLERLLFLYYEFKEAGISGYNTEFDIIRKTIDFYKIIKKRLTGSLKGVYNYALYHFKERFDIDRNIYIEAIDRNILYIEKILKDSSSNFRHKLKRGDWLEREHLIQRDQNIITKEVS